MKRININYKPLDKSVNLRIVSGSLTQQYNATAREYIPDHTLVPLVIQPDVYVTDPDNIITPGLKNSVLTDIIWYEDEVISGKQISSSDTSYTIDTSATGTRGRISVKKNIPEGRQLTLIFTARFVDTRTGQAVPVNGGVPLCVAQAVETATPRVLASYPVGSRLYPTTGQRGLKVDCKLMAGDVELSPTWKWQVYEGSAYRDLTSTDQAQGLGTSRLWVPAGLMGRQTRIKTVATHAGKAYTAEHVLGIAYERYDVDIIVPGNGEVTPDMASVTVRAKVWNNRGVIDRPSTYFKLEWLDQNNVKLGEGETLEITKARYASADFGVSLRVSELYSGLVLGEKAWVLGDVGSLEPMGGFLRSGSLNALISVLFSLKHAKGVKVEFVPGGGMLLIGKCESSYTSSLAISRNAIAIARAYDDGSRDDYRIAYIPDGLIMDNKVNTLGFKAVFEAENIDFTPVLNGSELSTEYVRGFFYTIPRETADDYRVKILSMDFPLKSIVWGDSVSLGFGGYNLSAKYNSGEVASVFTADGKDATEIIKQIVI